jgi:glycosyltransferase involved in cell wall biosynthesis
VVSLKRILVLNVLHISPSFYPAAHYGGTIYSGYGLCNGLAQIPGVNLRVLTTDSDGPTGGKRIETNGFPGKLPAGYDVYYCRRRFGADVSPRMLWLLWPMIRWADVVHLTAVYSPPTIPTLLLCKLLRKPVMWSPRGGLQRWEGSTRRQTKRVWDKLCNFLCDRGRVKLHLTSEAEQSESIAAINRTDSVIIPNGIDFPNLNGRRSRQRSDALELLFLGRLHPIKGIENLLRALATVEAPVHLSICGEGEEDYRQGLKILVRDLSLTEKVAFHGRVDGEAKERQFARADLCVVPSFKENFCIVVAEALARGVPVIASQGTPWQGIEANGCGFWVSNETEELARAIQMAAGMPLAEMGTRGRAWMEREYSWQKVATEMSEEYRALIGACTQPATKHVREAA